MATLDSLPADQRAVLQLVVQQRRAYSALAGLLGIDEAAVRERALAACDALGPEAGARLAPERRAELVDFLLDQQSAAQRERTRSYMSASEGGRDWASAVAGALGPLGGDVGSDIPAAAAPAREAPPAPEPEPALERERPPARPRREPRPPRPRREPGPRRPLFDGARRPPSRVGGAILIGAGVVLAIVLVIVLSSGGDNPKKTSAAATTTPTTTTPARPIAQINLRPPGGGSKPLGVAQIIAQGNRRGMGIAAQGLSPTTKSRFYAAWLYNSPTDAAFLGFAPPVTSNGRLQAFAQTLPANFTRYSSVVVSSESVDLSKTNQPAPKTPQQIVLRGPLTVTGQ
jgi:hypothetical protein